MATTSPDNIRTPNSGDQYALVQDLGTLADTVQNALIKRANAYVGTTAQRNAFTSQAPVGTIWSDTDGDRLVWKRGASGWEELVEQGEDTGWVPLGTANAYPPVGHGSPTQIRKIGDIVYVRGRLKRSDNSNFADSTAGYGLLTIPVAYRPAYTTRQTLSTTGTAGSIPYGHAEISSASGEMRAWLNGPTPWVGFDFWWSTEG